MASLHVGRDQIADVCGQVSRDSLIYVWAPAFPW